MSSFKRLSDSTPYEMQADNEKKEDEDSDIRLLKKMGYSQELYRGFSPFMSFAFCFTSVSVLTSVSLGFTYMLNTGGSGVTVWFWIIGSIFTILIGCSLAEICSVYPSAGSVYHWAGQLVSARDAPLASFTCGWFNFAGNLAGDAAYASGFVSIVNAIIVLNGRPSLSVNIQVMMSIGLIFTWGVINGLRIDTQGWLSNLAAVFQIAVTLIIATVLFIMPTQRATVHDVFFSTYNGTGFPFAYVCCISILSTLFAFSGYEAGAHLAEETRGASRAAPRGLVATVICSAVVGFIYLLALLFAIPNVDQFLKNNNGNDDTINLTIATYQLAVSHRYAMLLAFLLVCNFYFTGITSITVTSRIFFSMARDGVFPFSYYLRSIFEGTKTPLAAIVLICFLDCSLLLLQLVSSAAFLALLAISTVSLQISYLIPILFRCTIARKTFPVGEFNLGRFGVPISIISSIWLIVTSIFMLFPTHYPVTISNMNYSIVVIGGVMLIAGIHWFVSARYTFLGPKRTDSDTTPLLPGHVANENIAMKTILSE